ncbi:Choline-sulfatase [Planctomycetes bacterium Pla163]|uniref:Choline-sulfatase n=1 Tax=Rohdeia mirabilis TaxID=2528008 RepID=A0A518CZ14_9BACT|nr:Choline-sulfatase [Planctomycetes bacterium Pla163]
MLRRNLSRAVVAAILLSAIDAFSTRLGLPHRPAGPALFLQGVLLWLVPTLVATAVLALAARARVARFLLVRGTGDEARPLRLAFVVLAAAAPVLMHSALNAFTSIGGDLSRLKTPAPWLTGLGLMAAGLVTVLLAERLLARAAAPARAGLVLAAILIGSYLPPGGLPEPERPTLTSADAPNLLLMVWDTARAGSFSFLGGERATTPALAELAERSLVFDNARSVTHFTFTSHLSMLTGRYPTEHGARLLDTRHLPESGGETLAQELQRAGYRTGAFVGTGVLRATTGLDAGFDTYEDRVDPAGTETHLWALVHDLQAVLIRKKGLGWNDGEPHWIQDFQRPADGPLDEARAWIENGDDRPWFAFVNMFDVHWPYNPTDAARARYATKYDGVVGGHASRANDFPDGYVMEPEDDAHLLSLYEAEFADLDVLVSEFLDSLDLDASNTAVLITADHGEAFGEGGEYEHENILEPQVTVPMVLRLPGAAPRSGRSSVPVSGIDVAPTLRALAGLPARTELGLDLAAEDLPDDRVVYVEDRDHHDVEKAQFAAYSGRFKLVWLDALHDDRFELYDLELDPIGLIDRANEHPDVFRALKARLTEERDWLPLDAVEGRAGGGIDADALRALGYMGD